jgi:tRNA pseudouridine synthase 10
MDSVKSYLSGFGEYVPKLDIGTILHHQFYENEDYLRSMFQIRGMANIKYEINSLIREKITNSTGCSIDHIYPEIKFEIVIQNDLSFSIISKNKEIYLLGRYRKLRRGISQKNRPKKGNVMKSNLNSNKQENYDQSVESFVNEIMSQTYNIDLFKISWTGGEDKDSLVLGSGRPFIVKANSYLPMAKQKELFISKGIEIDFERIEPKDIESIHRYKQTVRVLLRLNTEPEVGFDLVEKMNDLVGNIRFVIKNKTVTRRIYEVKIITARGEDLELILCMDNGIPIKQFIGGNDPIEPCLSDVLKVGCECIYFDIIEFTQC